MLRRRSIRTRIVVLVLVPVIALIGLYVVALSLTLGSYLSLLRAASVRDTVTNPITNVQLQLNTERGLALEYLADPSRTRLPSLVSQESDTDAAIRAFTSAAARANSDASPGQRQASRMWATELATLPALRYTVVNVGLSRAAAATSYSALIAGADVVLTQAVVPVLNSSALIQANDLLSMEESLQAVAEERDLFTADLTNHSYPVGDARRVDELVAQHRELWSQATASLDTQYQKIFAADIPVTASKGLTGLESQILAGPRSAMQIQARAWISTNNAYAAGFRKALRSVQSAIRQTGYAQAGGVLLRLLLIGGLGLCAIAGAIAFAIILSRALLQQLDDLRLSALELSSVRLPVVLARLRSGESVNIASETPQLEPGPNEIGQLGRAFNLAAQTAVTAAADEAEIRRGVNDVFRNLARRNQSLLTRQLELLDAMERRVDDPEELADLFRIDHLTTRMRRHAEGLLIVAGGSSGRAWRDPVPIVDVMRAAVAEIEDYTRIRVASRSSSSVAGHAVADVIHLLAELVENATTFSPANTPVRIESDNVAKGLVVEIEDRGLGMSQAQIAEINAKLNDPPLLDLSGSEQLGLFIAGQLARRHDVKITMRGSAYGGVIAVVLLPTELVIDPGYDEPLTIVGIRELGGRPVPQLPAAATPTDEEAAISGRPVADADLVGSPGYLVDLESAATSITTTAAHAAELVPDELPPVGPAHDDLLGFDMVPSDADSADAGASKATAADLKGAGAWLVDAYSPEQTIVSPGGPAGAQQPESEPESSSTPLTAGMGAEPPKLILGPTTELPVATAETSDQVTGTASTFDPLLDPVFGPVDTSPWSSVQAGRVDHSVGWPTSPLVEDSGSGYPDRPADRDIAGSDRFDPLGHGDAVSTPIGGSVGWPDQSATSSDWLSLASDAAKHPGAAGDLPRRGADRPAEDSSIPRHDTSPGRRPDGPSNGSADEAYATGTVPLLPKRSARSAGSLRGRDPQASPWSDARLGGGSTQTPDIPEPTEPPETSADTESFAVFVADQSPPPELDGLPVRVRQASIAPQLRDQMATKQPDKYVAAPQMSGDQAAPTEVPSPEAARSFMSALQRGWERGRSMAEQMTDEPDGDQS